jgi:hypothetical protein
MILIALAIFLVGPSFGETVPNDRNNDARTIGTPDADIDLQTWTCQQGHKVIHFHSNFSQHFIKEEPQRGGEISETIF